MGMGLLLPAHQPEQLFAGRHRSNSGLGRRYPAPRAGGGGSGGGSRAEIGQEHFIKCLSLPLASGDLWGAAVRDAVQVSSCSHPAGASLAFRSPRLPSLVDPLLHVSGIVE